MSDLVPYDQARIMLAEAKAVDDVKRLLDAFERQGEAAHAAGNSALEAESFDLQMWATRRLGELINARQRDRERFISLGRKSFRPGRRQPCHVCGKFRYMVEGHHVVPLGEQFDRGFGIPDHEHVWLCPNHHVIIHLLISPGISELKRGRRAVPILADLDEQQIESVMDLISRSGRMPA